MERPKVGIGVLIMDKNNILLGKRKSSPGQGYWGPPGGHLEFGESWEMCAKREVLEETGLLIFDAQFYAVTNDIFQENGKHYISIFMCALYNGEPIQNLEPEKCERWKWFALDQLPTNLFLPLANLMKQRSNIFLHGLAKQ